MFALIFILLLIIASVVTAYTIPNEKVSNKKDQKY